MKTRTDLKGIPCPEGAKLIPLTQNKYAIVDERFYDELMKHSFYAAKWVNKKWYSVAYKRKGDPAHWPKNIKMHQLVMELAGVIKPGEEYEIDHINHTDTLDNRLSNLRFVTRQENLMNRAGAKGWKKRGIKNVSSKKSGYKGRRVYYAQLMQNGNRHTGPARYSIYLAAEDANELMREYHGEFARLNDLSRIKDDREVHFKITAKILKERRKRAKRASMIAAVKRTTHPSSSL